MCGIAGFQGSYEQDLLQAMTDAVAHRGPDGDGTVILRLEGQPDTGLGHRRLAIIDLSSAGAQPMTVGADAGGGMQTGLTLVFNGEIYNFRELRAELVQAGHCFASRSDSEVLLHLYEREGLDMLQRLNGIFAFALHDARCKGRPPGVERGSLLLARDQMGVKPLYYAETPRGFLFGSEIKALLRDRSLSRDVDPVALHYTLAYLWSPAPQTMLSSIRKLEPGAGMLVLDGKVRRKWTFSDVPYNGVTSNDSEAALTAELAAGVRTAVERQLVADVPVGAFLSGGLDSSAIVAMMRQLMPDDKIQCFSIGFREGLNIDGTVNDLPYARRVARHLNVDLEELQIDSSAIGRLEEMIELLDEPQADPAPINALIIAEKAREMGIPVLLSGAGGDDLFSGYRRHWAVNFERRWAWLPKPVRSSMQSIAASGPGQSRPVFRRLAKMFAHAGEEPDRRLVSYFIWGSDQVRRALYTPGFAARVAEIDTARPLLDSLARIPAERDPLQRMLYLDARHFLADHNLNYTDRAGMAVGVEVRVPLLDADLVQLATRVPSHMKQQGRTGKAIFKHAMEPYLPRDVIYRPKTGFGVPLRAWLRNELRPMVRDTLNADALKRRGFFEPAAVDRLIKLNDDGRLDASNTIFALMCMELWFRRFLD